MDKELLLKILRSTALCTDVYAHIYRVILEDKSIFWEEIVSVIVRKIKVHTNMCLILKAYRHRAVTISRPNCVRLLFVRLDEERSLQKTAGHTDELLARILDAAVCINKREDQLRRTARDSPHLRGHPAQLGCSGQLYKKTPVFPAVIWMRNVLCLGYQKLRIRQCVKHDGLFRERAKLAYSYCMVTVL
jgi:hypothetical protein